MNRIVLLDPLPTQIQQKLLSLMSEPRKLIFSPSAVFLTRGLSVPYELIHPGRRVEINHCIESISADAMELFSFSQQKCMQVNNVNIDTNVFKEDLIVALFRVFEKVYQ